MNYFVYNGVRSSDMGVRIMSKNVFSAPKYDLAFQSIPGRSGDLINPNGRFPNVTISYTCFLPAKSISELADKITSVKAWLYTEPDRYHILTDSYDTNFQRKGVFNNKLDIADECNKIGTFTVNFTCLPFRFSVAGQKKSTHTATSFSLTNPYPFASKPHIKIHGSGSGRLIVQSSSNNAIWSFLDIDGYVECDSEMMNFYKDTVLKNDTVEGDGFPFLHQGKNTITFDGGITKIEIIPRWVCI